MAEVDLTFIAHLVQQNLEATKRLEREVSDVRRLATLTAEFTRRLDRRMDDWERRSAELKDDLELIVKIEVSGRIANAETSFENRQARLERRVEALEEAIGPRS